MYFFLKQKGMMYMYFYLKQKGMMYIGSLLLYPTPTSIDVTTVTSCAVKHDTVTLPFAAGTLS